MRYFAIDWAFRKNQKEKQNGSKDKNQIIHAFLPQEEAARRSIVQVPRLTPKIGGQTKKNKITRVIT
jgi:hypothetical protein